VDDLYRSALKDYIKTERSQAVQFIDAAIRFMNSIKKMKIEDILKYFTEEGNYDSLTDSLVIPELLMDPIEDELTFNKNLTPADKSTYEEVLKLLKSGSEMKV